MAKKRLAQPPPGRYDLPVRVTVQPVTRCAVPGCGTPVTYPREPGAANDALTTHWNRVHGGNLHLLAVATGTA